MAPVYGMAATMPMRGMVGELLRRLLMCCTRCDQWQPYTIRPNIESQLTINS